MDYWISENVVDHSASVITASSSAGALTVENLRDPRVSKVWRSGAAAGGEIRVNLLGPQYMSAIGVFGVDDDEYGTSVRIRLGASAGSGSVLDWSGLTNHGQAVWRAPVITEADGFQHPDYLGAPWLTVTLDSAREIGRIFAGAAGVYPQVGHTLGGSSWQMVDLSLRSITPRNGAFLIDVADTRRIFTAAYDALSRDELIAFDKMDRTTGGHGQVMFVPEPSIYDPSNWGTLGYIRELPENQFLGHMRGGRTVSIVEAG